MRSVLIACLSLAHVGAAAQAKTVRRGAPFTVYCHFDDAAVADRARVIVDHVRNVAQLAFSRGDLPIKAKLGVHLYRDRARYAAAGKRLKNELWNSHPGFADGRTMTCHCLLSEPAWWSEDALYPGAANLIAHESMHLAVYEYCKASSVFHPQWFAEGVALWAEGEVARLEGRSKTRESDPIEGDSTRQAQRVMKERGLPKVAAILRDDLRALADADRYPIIRLFYLMLAERHTEALTDVLQTAKTDVRAPAIGRVFADTIEARLGDAAFAKLDAEFAEFVRKRKIAAHVRPPFLGADAVGKPGDAGFRPGSPDVRWLGVAAARGFEANAKVTIHAQGAEQADFVFAHTKTQTLRVSLVVGAGVYVLFRAGAKGPWKVLGANLDVDALTTGKALRLRITARRTTGVRVWLNGKSVVSAKLGKLPPAGRWGVGAPVGCRAAWKDLRVK